MAITAWSAKVCSSATALSAKAPRLARATPMVPIERPSRSSGTRQDAAEARALRASSRVGIARLGAHVGDLDRLLLDDRAADVRRRGIDGHREGGAHRVFGLRGQGAHAGQVHHVAVEPRGRAACRRRTARAARSAMASNTGCTSVGDSLITRQDLGGGGLPLQRLLRLVEQPRVLDRDHRLVGEGLEQRDLLVGERRRPRRADTRVAPMPRPSHSIGATAPSRMPSPIALQPARDAGGSRRPSDVGRCAAVACSSMARDAIVAAAVDRGSTATCVQRARRRRRPRRRPRESTRPSSRTSMSADVVAREQALAAVAGSSSNTGCVSATELLIDAAAPRRWRSAAPAPPASR